jgi:inner membrane protein
VASAFAHAAVVLARGAARVPEALERRLIIATVACACFADLDYASLLFEVRPNETFGHRGATHSLFVAIAFAAIVALVLFRRQFLRVFAFLAVVAASHGILDAMTAGDLGVALFWPLTSARFHFPFALVASCPVGMNEYFGYWGLLTIANEVLYVVMPIALVVSFVGREDRRRRVVLAGGAWIVALFALRAFMPDEFRPTKPRILEPIDTERAGKLADIPRDGLPNGELVTRLDAFRALGLLDATLKPDGDTWSSNFFPSWFGSEGGRWMDGSTRLVWRTLFGFSPPTEASARAMSDDERFRLSPTEKLDIALGHWDFPATRQALARTHDAHPKPRYWNGRCNGVATAALAQREPFRVVEVIAKDGTRVRFHPNDVKALLAASYYKPESSAVIGEVCDVVAFDAPAQCDMNPAVLVVALLNRIGLAKKSFLIDALPTIAKQYYAVAAVRVHAGDPRSIARDAIDASLAPRVKSLVPVDIELTLSSTTLAMARANVALAHDATRYARVGLVPVVMHYTATLALAEDTSLVGGVWTGNPPDGPDDILLVATKPALTESGTLDAADRIPWQLVEELAHASTDDASALPTIDLRARAE